MSVKYNRFWNGNERTPLARRIDNYINNIQPVEECSSPSGDVNLLSAASRNQKLLLIFSTTAHFLAAAASSHLTPFFPVDAEKKGVSQTMVGFVLSVYQLNVFIVSPFIGNYLRSIGTKFVYLTGIFVGGIGSILFGILHLGPDGTSFIVMSVLCRSTEAIGFTGFITASMAIMSNEFTEHVGTVSAILETGASFGFMCGPVLGGALYELGGYGLPFYVIGVLVLVNGVTIYLCMPDIPGRELGTTCVKNHRKSIFNFVLRSSVLMPLMSVLMGVTGVFVLDSTFTKHVEQFDFHTAFVGLLFAIPPATYALTAPIYGYMIDAKDYRLLLTIFGYFLFSVGFLFCGPSQLLLPFLPYHLWAVVVGLFSIGVSLGCLYIPTMNSLSLAAYDAGYDKSTDTFAMISGLFNSVLAFGGFVGSFAGAASVDRFGYSTSYTAVSFLSILALLMHLSFRAFQYFTKSGNGNKSCMYCGDICDPKVERNTEDLDDFHQGRNRKTNGGSGKTTPDYEDNHSTASFISGIPALSLSLTYSEHSSSSSATNRGEHRTLSNNNGVATL